MSGSGRIALTDQMDAELTLRFANTSLDPYLRFFAPQLSPFTNAIAGGTVRVVGELADVDHLAVDGLRRAARSEAVRLPRVEQPASAGEPRALTEPDRSSTLNQHVSTSCQLRLFGEGTELDLDGNINLHDSTIAVPASGDANLGILQGFFATSAARRAASLQAPRSTGRWRSRSSPAARRSPTAGSASSRCRIRSRRSTARSRSIAGGIRSTTCARGWPAAT